MQPMSVVEIIQTAMKKIVLIGASGYVGAAILAEALSRGIAVVAVVRYPSKIKLTHPNLKVTVADVSSAGMLAGIAAGADAVISAYNPGWQNPRIYEEIQHTYPQIIAGVKRSGVTRLLVVGGAGGLYVAPGVRLIDRGVPSSLRPGILGQAEVYEKMLKPERQLDWVFLAPPANMHPGKRTGVFRLGQDDLIVDAPGNSDISVEDYAVAMVDEFVKPAHHRERFTVGY